MSWKIPAAVGGVLALGAAAVVALNLPGAHGGFGGPALNIAVVAPEEPPVTEGEVMGVGDLVDGYEHQPIAPAPQTDVDPLPTAWLEDGGDEDRGPARVSDERRFEGGGRPYVSSAEEFDPGPRDRGPLDFGFDDPRPDYGAARRERRERMERRAAEEERRMQAYPSSADLRPSETFY